MKRTLIALGVGLALVVALLIVREMGYLSAVKSRHVFDTTQQEAIQTLHVTLHTDSVTLVKSGSRWVVLPDSFPADPARVALALSYLLRVEDKEIVSKSADAMRLAEFGLTPEEMKAIQWSDASGETALIHLGHTSSSDFNSTFWKRPDEPEVYRTPGNFTHEIGVRPHDWKDKTLFPAFEPSEIKAVQVRWSDSLGRSVGYTITHGADSAYRLTALGRVDTSLVPTPTATALFGQASQLLIDEIPDYNDPHAASLAAQDSAAVSIKVTLKNGKGFSLVTGGTLDHFVYFYHPVHRGVVTLFKSRIAPFQKSPAQILQPVSFNPDGMKAYETVTEPGAAP